MLPDSDPEPVCSITGFFVQDDCGALGIGPGFSITHSPEQEKSATVRKIGNKRMKRILNLGLEGSVRFWSPYTEDPVIWGTNEYISNSTNFKRDSKKPNSPRNGRLESDASKYRNRSEAMEKAISQF